MHEGEVMVSCSCSKASHHILFLPLHLNQSRLISESDLVNLALEWTKLASYVQSDLFVCMYTLYECTHVYALV